MATLQHGDAAEVEDAMIEKIGANPPRDMQVMLERMLADRVGNSRASCR